MVTIPITQSRNKRKSGEGCGRVGRGGEGGEGRKRKGRGLL